MTDPAAIADLYRAEQLIKDADNALKQAVALITPMTFAEPSLQFVVGGLVTVLLGVQGLAEETKASRDQLEGPD